MSELKEIVSEAYTAYEQSHYDRAADLFSYLIVQMPSHGGLWHGLASTRQAQGQFEEALKAWAMNSLLAPQEPLPHFHAATCYLALRRSDEAIKALNLALERPCTHDLIEKIYAIKEVISHAH